MELVLSSGLVAIASSNEACSFVFLKFPIDCQTVILETLIMKRLIQLKVTKS
jgi:hypothetical protein